MKQAEHEEQVSLVKWWAYACHNFNVREECLFAIPNGGFRHIAVAIKLKAEGVRSGVPDLFLAVPKGKYAGLFIEMKKPAGGRASDNQKSLLTTFRALGYAGCVCHGWLAAKDMVEKYFAEAI